MRREPMPRSRRCVLARLACVAAALSILWQPAPAQAWGPHGHRIAARVAEARLTPEARKAVRELLLDGDTLADVSDWADHEGHDAVPGSASWHYVNVPIQTASAYNARYCRGGNCVVDKIKHFRTVLADRRTPIKERRRALLFFVHLVEDVHQPLHVGDNNDRGGNTTQVQFLGEGTNLHRLWDSGLIAAIDRRDNDWVERCAALLTPENERTWSKGTAEDWATESLRDARAAYLYSPGGARPLESGTRLGRDYEERMRPILERRLAQAGLRLANELNALFR